MSWHLSHRLTAMHRAVSVALLCSVSYGVLSSGAQAATIGKTTITSAQHEPLVASIVVTNINAADFSASLANPIVYQQMGLTPTDSMSVRFKPTSANSGQVIISTSQPVSTPFADVVLAINDAGQRNVIPKTLLMPLNDSRPIKPSSTVITGAKKPNLPVVSVTNAKPLTVRQGTPPPLLSAPDIQTARTQAPAQILSLPTAIVSTPQANRPSYAPSRMDQNRLDSSLHNRLSINNTLTITNASNDTSSNGNGNGNGNGTPFNQTSLDATRTATAALKNPTPTSTITDKQLDILNIQVTRQIQPSNMVSTRPSVSNLDTDNTTAATAPMSSIPSSKVPLSTDSAPQTIPAEINTTTSSGAVMKSTTNSTVNYTVQRNDNLWIIAQQIAQKNNLDVQSVMTQIKSQNPDAFINQDADQLKADAQLSLPNYEVVPSQQSLQAAISAQRQYRQQARVPTAKKEAPLKPTSDKPSDNTQVAKRPDKPTPTTTQALPKARFSVVAPSRDGSTDGTQTKAATTAGNGLSTDILATLKSSRQRTAAQAQRLSKTSSTLGSYTKKLQLQNQKLAELQARLKKLRNQ